MLELKKPRSGRCGAVGLIGRPNVGKSTLLNHLLGQKISITSHRPQTTRYAVRGIKTIDDDQLVFVDTPGLHGSQKRELNRYMNRAVQTAVMDVDVIVWLVDGLRWTEDDDKVAQLLADKQDQVIMVINKVDQVHPKTRLLEHLEHLAKKFQTEIIPISALKGSNTEQLEDMIRQRLPDGPHWFDEDTITDQSQRSLAAEFVREQVMRQLGQEVPYSTTVETSAFEADKDCLRIGVIIWVEQPGQKGIIIGKGGKRLKQIGQQARQAMEECFGQKVFLESWVRVRKGWSDDQSAMQKLGYLE